MDVSRWRLVATLTAGLAILAVVGELATSLATDHLWVLVALVVLAAGARALAHGGARSILVLAGLTLVSQPALHLLGELTHTDDDYLVAHGGVLSGLMLATHLAVVATMVAGLGATERLVQVFTAALRRLARVFTSPVLGFSLSAPAHLCSHPVVLSHSERERSPQPPRRGPPLQVFAGAV